MIAGRTIAIAGLVGVVASSVLAALLVLLSITDPANTSAAGYLPLAWSAAAVLLVVLVLSLVIKRVDLTVSRGVPWLVGLVSVVVSFLPWWGVSGGNPELGAFIYRGLRVPQGIMQFWDLALIMQSVDCARWGFDIYANNNGCLQDPSIYAPGMVWVQYVPFNVFSQASVPILGVAMIIISSLVLLWLARQSSGLGQLTLLVAAVGGPWLLLLERGNIDAVIIWAAAVAVLLVRRWGALTSKSALWPWIAAAGLLWLMGTWKYYPFALGIMLLPVLRVRGGWAVLASYGVASLGFVVATWDNFRFSSSTNVSMVDFGDFVVLGRIPVVARMLGTEVGAGGLQLGDVLLLLMALLAVAWGVGVGVMLRRSHVWLAMLAAGGSALYLTAVVISGFGYGYKAAFLLLAVPLISRLVTSRRRLIAGSALGVLLLLGVQSVVVWNTVMVTTAGIIVAAFAVGLGCTLMLKALRPSGRRFPADDSRVAA